MKYHMVDVNAIREKWTLDTFARYNMKVSIL